jgi:hypothetical protein
MATIFRPIALATLLVALVTGYAGDAAAQNLTIPAPPTKDIVIYNNSPGYTIYPMLQIGMKIGNPDLWMQAQLVSFFPDKNPYPPFPTTFVYRAYVNPTNGIPPGGSVEIKVPFYTQLTQVTVASYQNPPPVPPVLSSNPPDFPATTCVPPTPPIFKTPNLGTAGQGIVYLWNKCTSSSSDTTATCTAIRRERDFFNTNTCPAAGCSRARTR